MPDELTLFVRKVPWRHLVPEKLNSSCQTVGHIYDSRYTGNVGQWS